MHKKGKLIYALLSIILPLSLSSCGSSDENASNDDIASIYDLYVKNGGELSYEDRLESIKGEKGDKGDTGEKGEAGADGKDGVSILSIAKTSSQGNVDIYTITYSDGRTSNFTITNGEDGSQGIQGEKGEDGHTPVITIGENGNWFIDGVDSGVAATGAKGDKGEAGKDGENAPHYGETFTITYHLNGGIIPNDWYGSYKVSLDESTATEVINWGDTIDLPSATKTEYNFLGWFTNSNDVNNPTRQRYITDAVFSDLDLYANFSVNTYSITYDLDGGTLDEQNPSEYYKGAEVILHEPTKEGYTFLGWYKDNVLIESGDLLNCSGNIELIAKRKANIYKVELNFNNSESTKTVEFTYGNEYSLNDPDVVPEGFEFIGRYYNDEKIPTSGTWGIADEVTLVAKYDSLIYDLLLNDDRKSYSITGLKGEISEDGNLNIISSCNGLPVTKIADNSFSGCTSLISITIPDSITSIGSKAFDGCSSLKSIIIPDSVTYLGFSAFSNCSSLEELEIPNLFNKFLGYYFGGEIYNAKVVPQSLKKITINNGSVIDNALYGCSSLISIKLGRNVTTIGFDAFKECSSVEELVLNNFFGYTLEHYFGFGEGYRSTLVPDSLQYVEVLSGDIPDYAFRHCTNLANVKICEGTTSIGDNAFNGCSKLQVINLPHTITSIGESAFGNCDSLTSITIPDGVTSIEGGTFASCESLTSITIPDGVVSIGGSAFANCSSLKSITIPDGVKSIGGYAFAYCSSLTSITIPDGVTSIESGTFSGCESLTSITIPDGVASIGYSAFEHCTSLTSVEISDNVTSIDEAAFGNCTSLTSITIPDSVASIGGSAFSRCTSLVSVKLPNNIKEINDNMFMDCSSLTSIDIPDSVVSIKEQAFADCSALTAISLSDNITSIGYRAFAGCTSMTSIVIGKGLATIEGEAFGYCSSLEAIYYTGTTAEWENINIEEFGNDALDLVSIYYYSESEPTDTTYQYWHYVDGVPTPWIVE